MTDKQVLCQLISLLGGTVSDDISLDSLEAHWRALINQKQAEELTDTYLAHEDAYLEKRSLAKVLELSICDKTAYPNLLLYRGDLTRLKVDVLVNAANSAMLGCFVSNHSCLDNAIHTFAGARLRLACQELMVRQGHKEPIGQVKVTSAYHLPARLIYHTVGPYVPRGKMVSPIRQELLKKSYLSCLKQAQADDVSSIAFPCLSTGEFGFPKDLASQIAVETVLAFLAEQTSDLTVIFGLYTEEDWDLYTRLLKDRTSNVTKKETL